MKKLIPLLVIVLVVFGIYKISAKPTTNSYPDSEADLILYWGDGCPHCENVKKYISEHQIDQKVKISFKEVYYNRTNQNLLAETAKKCPSIDTSQGIGVPFGYSPNENKCLYGDQPIIDWLAAK